MMAMIVMITQAWSALVVTASYQLRQQMVRAKVLVIMQIQKMDETLKSQ